MSVVNLVETKQVDIELRLLHVCFNLLCGRLFEQLFIKY